MADHSLANTARTTDSSQAAEIWSSLTSTLGPATSILSSETSATAMAKFSSDLRELEAANALSTLGMVSKTQWSSTEAIMHELSTDSEVTFRKVLGSAKILPIRPGVDPLEVTRPMPDLSDVSQSPMTATPSVIARSQSGSVPSSSSSRMRVIYHNWSATKQRPHPQSVAEIIRHCRQFCRYLKPFLYKRIKVKKVKGQGDYSAHKSSIISRRA